MFTTVQIDEDALNAKLQKRLFLTLVFSGCIANLVGFLSNLVLFGMSFPTMLCGVCELIVILYGVVGIRFQKQKIAATLMMLIFTLIEFPFLYYVYGASMGVYLILGIIGLAVYFPRPYHIAAIIVTVLLDVAVIIISYVHPSTIEAMTKANQFETMVCSFVIVATTSAVILCNLIGQYIAQHKHMLEVSRELEYAAHHDALTGVYNRRYLIDTLRQWMGTKGKHFLVALIDIDGFKNVNDTYGHVYGDEILVELARLMREEIRGKGMVARYGGEEFMLLFEQSDRAMAMEILDRVKAGLGEYSRKTRQVTITFSGGMEEYSESGQIDQLFHNADKKLYQAKCNGKNQVI